MTLAVIQHYDQTVLDRDIVSLFYTVMVCLFLQLCGLSTIIREYIALRSVSSLPFKDFILNATEQSCGFGDDAWKISGPLHDYFKENLNKSQKEAIDVSLAPCNFFRQTFTDNLYTNLGSLFQNLILQVGLSRKSFVLIQVDFFIQLFSKLQINFDSDFNDSILLQGPPGTGKTQTILSILGAIMHATPARVQSKYDILLMPVSLELCFLMLLVLVDNPFFFHNRGVDHEVKRRIQMTVEEKYDFAPF